jgi:hypothetical protein
MTILDITRRGTKNEGQEDRGGVFGQAPSWMAWRGMIVVPFGQVLVCHSRGRNASVSPHPPMKGAKGDTRPVAIGAALTHRPSHAGFTCAGASVYDCCYDDACNASTLAVLSTARGMSGVRYARWEEFYGIPDDGPAGNTVIMIIIMSWWGARHWKYGNYGIV